MNEESHKQAKASQKFWDAFKASVEENRVTPDRSLFYVKWGQAFVNFLPGKRLRDRSRQDIEAFLADLGKRTGVDPQISKGGLRMDLAVCVPCQEPLG
ncbi:MAG: hypothetical protein WC560_11000 [Syntrophales bacterium]